MNSKHFERIGRILRGLTLGCALALLASACVTTPTSSSSSSGGMPGMPGTPGSTGMPSTSGTSGTGGRSGTSPAPATTPGMPAGQSPGSPGTGMSDDLAGGNQSGDAAQRSQAKQGQSEGKSGGQSGEKTDDEILAEALEEFDRRKAQANAAGGGKTAAGETPDSSGRPPSGEEGPGTAGAGQAADSVTGRPLTDSEQTAMLQGQLDDRYAKFDQVMLQERELVTRQDNEEGNRGYRDEEGGLGSGEEEGEPGSGEEFGEEMGEGLEGGRSSAGGVKGIPGNPGTRPSESPPAYEPPPDLASADGDDIIARQLREAAMNEPDPELREKLWDEYRKYKRGQK